MKQVTINLIIFKVIYFKKKLLLKFKKIKMSLEQKSVSRIFKIN